MWTTDPWTKLQKAQFAAELLGAQTVVVHPPFRWQRDYARGFRQGHRSGWPARPTSASRSRTCSRCGSAAGRCRPTSRAGTSRPTSRTATTRSTCRTPPCRSPTRWRCSTRWVRGSATCTSPTAPARRRTSTWCPAAAPSRARRCSRRLAARGFTGHVVVEINTRRALDRAEREADLAEALAFCRLHLVAPQRRRPRLHRRRGRKRAPRRRAPIADSLAAAALGHPRRRPGTTASSGSSPAPVSRAVVRRFVGGAGHRRRRSQAARGAGRRRADRHARPPRRGHHRPRAGRAVVTAYLDLLDRAARAGPDRAPRPAHRPSRGQREAQRDRPGAARRTARRSRWTTPARICAEAQRVGATVTLDMEDHTTTDSTLEILRELRAGLPGDRRGAAGLPAPHRGATAAICPTPAAGSGCARAPTTSRPSVALQQRDRGRPLLRAVHERPARGRRLPDVRHPRPAADRHRDRPGRARGKGRTELRVPDAVRHPARRAAPAGRGRPYRAGLHPLRRPVVRLPDAAAGRTTGQPGLLRPRARSRG